MPINNKFTLEELDKIKALKPTNFKQFTVGKKKSGKPKDIAKPVLEISSSNGFNFFIPHLTNHSIPPHPNSIQVDILNKGQTLAGEVRLSLYFLGFFEWDATPLRFESTALLLDQKVDIGVLLQGENRKVSFELPRFTLPTQTHGFVGGFALVCYDLVSDPYNISSLKNRNYNFGQFDRQVIILKITFQ